MDPIIERPLLQYVGSKWRLAKWIVKNFPKHRLYVEPFGGTGALFFFKLPVASEIYNDVNDKVVTFFRVLQDPIKREKLKEKIFFTPYAHSIFDEAHKIYTCPNEHTDIDLAYSIFVCSWMSFHGGGLKKSNRGFGCQVDETNFDTTKPARWLRIPRDIDRIVDRWKRIQIENRDAFDVIEYYDRDFGLFYLDPPYLERVCSRRNTNDYVQVLSEDDHAKLLWVARNLRGYCIISGYHSDLYDHVLRDWHCLEREYISFTSKLTKEVIWISPRTWQANYGKRRNLLEL